MLSRSDWIGILITFVMGFIVGGYIYFTGFTGTFSLPTSFKVDPYSTVITGESYGQCSNDKNCLSFQLLADGSYRILYENAEVQDKLESEGSLSRSLRGNLNKALTGEALEVNSVVKNAATCKYGADATNYRFVIERNAVEYVIDTCVSDIDYDGALWKSLVEVWNDFVKETVN